jgi:hypothetical protein
MLMVSIRRLSVLQNHASMSLKQISVWLFSAGVLFFTLVVYFKRIAVASGDYGNTDFYKFYESVLFYFSGQNIYSGVIVKSIFLNANLNPPFFTFLLLPLYFFNYAQAYQIWSVISLACILGGAYLALRPFPQWRKNTLPMVALFALYLPCSEILTFGQITGLLLVILSGAWLFARKNKEFSAGVLIGLACSLKLFCGLFLIYFLCLKRFRILFAAVGTILVTALIGLWMFGIQAYLAYHANFTSIRWYAANWNVSFYGFFEKLFSNAEKNSPLIIAPHLVVFCTAVCSIVLIAFLVKIWRKGGSLNFDRGFALVMVSMLLLSPLGWIYYFPLLLIPYLVLVSESNELVHLGVCFLLLLSTLTGNYEVPTHMKTASQIFLSGGFGFYILLSLLVLLSWRTPAQKEISTQPQPQSQAITENLWILIYSLIFIPSLISLVDIFRNMTA